VGDLALDSIEWSKLPRPRADGYDTRAVAALAAQAYGFVKRIPEPGQPSMFDGKVALVHYAHDPAPGLTNARFNHPNIARADDLLRQCWPEMHAQCGELLQEIWPLRDARFPDDGEDYGAGCSCGNTAHFGGIEVTVSGALGLAEGIVHELGHWKLHAMGVHLEGWTNLVANGVDELFESPIRKDKPRPMGACIQAQYSYLHVLELNIRATRAGRCCEMLDVNRRRMAAGRETLRAWRPDANGGPFASAMDEWTAELLREAELLLEAQSA
jgi:HEXXH motif-containing protein